VPGRGLPEDRQVSAGRRIAVPAIAANAGNLDGTLMKLNYVRLLGVGEAVGARYRGVNRVVYRDRRMHQCSEELAIATIASAVVTGGDHVGADRSERRDASAQCGVPIAAIAANSSDLGRGLIKIPDIRLMGDGCRKGVGLRCIERLESSEAGIDQAPGKIAIPAISGVVA